MDISQVQTFLHKALQESFDEATCMQTLQKTSRSRLDQITRAHIAAAIAVYSEQTPAVSTADVQAAMELKTVGKARELIEQIQTRLES